MSRAVMTIHGFLTKTTDFGRLYDYLDFYDEVVAVELPGHNCEPPDFSLFNVEDTFKAVLDVYDSLRAKHDTVDAVGFSMGGALAAWLAAERDVGRAALVSPANKFINVAFPFSVGKFVNETWIDTFCKTKGGLGKRFSASHKVFTPYVQNMKSAMKIAKERTFKYMSRKTFSVFSKVVKQCNAEIEKSAPIDTPIFIMWGKLDELVPQRSLKYLTKHFPLAQVKIYPDVGHAVLSTNRDDELIADIVEFLTDGARKVTVPKRQET